MSKIVCIDGGVLCHRAIFSWASIKKKILDGVLPENMFLPPVSYTFFQMLLGSLKRIGIDKDDIVILALDKTNSWRKCFYSLYKGQRKALRDELEHVDWKYHYSIIDNVVQQIDESTNFHVMWLPKLWTGADLLFTEEGQKYLDEENVDLHKWYGVEADDIMAYACDFYKDKEIVIVSIDADLDQLCVKDNVKFFTLMTKYRGGRGTYKVINNGYKVLSKKIETGDVSDNIIPGVTDDNSETSQKLRELIIDLINLPLFVKDKLRPVFESLPEKQIHAEKLPFKNSLAKKFFDIYKKDKIITYEDSIARLERKKVIAKNKLTRKKQRKTKSMRRTKNG